MFSTTKLVRSSLLVALAVATLFTLGHTRRALGEPTQQQWVNYGSRSRIDGERLSGCVQFGRNFRGFNLVLCSDQQPEGKKPPFNCYEANSEYRELNFIVYRIWWLSSPKSNVRGGGLRLFFGATVLGQVQINDFKEPLRLPFSGSIFDECRN